VAAASDYPSANILLKPTGKPFMCAANRMWALQLGLRWIEEKIKLLKSQIPTGGKFQTDYLYVEFWNLEYRYLEFFYKQVTTV
jgi:hypothetical protein